MAKRQPEKNKTNPLLARFNDDVMDLAILKCTHFVGAHKLIAEGNRSHMDIQDAKQLRLLSDDAEGKLVQKEGVLAVVYSEKLWFDKSALLALMREDNANADVAKPETEVDAFGCVHQLMLASSCSSQTVIAEDEVMSQIQDIGFGNLSPNDWRILVRFRLLLPQAHATLLLQCLFSICNGRARSSVDNFAKINGLHPKRHAWAKVFLLLELYLNLLITDSNKADSIAALSQHSCTAPKVLEARKVDKAAIAELANERNILDLVTKFFVDTYKHYQIGTVVDDQIDEGQVIRANAGLMVALGRTLTKVGEALVRRKKEVQVATKHLVIKTQAIEAEDAEKPKIIADIMHDRLPKIEEKFSAALSKAKVFNDVRKKPKALHRREKSAAASSQPTAAGAVSQPEASLPDEVVVKVRDDGSLDDTMNIADVVKCLGLFGTGAGGRVHVRSLSTLLGTGIAFSAYEVRVVELNPPEATIKVTGVSGKDMNPIIKILNVNIDDLTVAEQDKVEREEKDPLKKRPDSSMQRLPAYDYTTRVLKWMEHEIESHLEQCACNTEADLAEPLEIINVTRVDEASHIVPFVQCRAKRAIPTAALRPFPHGGMLLAASAVSQRESVEARLRGLAQCYIKCVQMIAIAGRKTRDTQAPFTQEFLLYTAFNEKGLVETSASGEKQFGYVSHFWAVMLTDRDNADLVNMHPYIDEYKLPAPIATHFPMPFNVKVAVTLPFLTNKKDLSPGELLMLPYDGGCNELMSVPPSLSRSS